jgi:hypothetical protein
MSPSIIFLTNSKVNACATVTKTPFDFEMERDHETQKRIREWERKENAKERERENGGNDEGIYDEEMDEADQYRGRSRHIREGSHEFGRPEGIQMMLAARKAEIHNGNAGNNTNGEADVNNVANTSRRNSRNASPARNSSSRNNSSSPSRNTNASNSASASASSSANNSPTNNSKRSVSKRIYSSAPGEVFPENDYRSFKNSPEFRHSQQSPDFRHSEDLVNSSSNADNLTTNNIKPVHHPDNTHVRYDPPHLAGGTAIAVAEGNGPNLYTSSSPSNRSNRHPDLPDSNTNPNSNTNLNNLPNSHTNLPTSNPDPPKYSHANREHFNNEEIFKKSTGLPTFSLALSDTSKCELNKDLMDAVTFFIDQARHRRKNVLIFCARGESIRENYSVIEAGIP